MGKNKGLYFAVNKNFALAEGKNKTGLGKKSRVVLAVLASLFVGVANGLFGGGGGMLVIPIFVLILRLEEKVAHASAILTILPLSLVSGVIYIINGHFLFPDGVWTGGGVILGGIIGSFLMKKLSGNALKLIFYSLMILAGVVTLTKNIG